MSMIPDADLSRIPAGIPPHGISPNFVNPQTLAPAILSVSIAMMIWALLFVTIRIYANFHAPRGLGVDDCFCIIATILGITYTGLVLSLVSFAQHSFDIPLIRVDGYYLKINYATSLISLPTLFFAKSTILLVYLRVFSIKKDMRYSVWFGLVWTFVLYWIDVPLQTYFCAARIGKAWDIETIGKSCSRIIPYAIIEGVLSVALDLYIFLLPIPIVLRLQTSLKRRLSILGVFGTAILGIAAAVVGMVYRIKLHTTDDLFWASACLHICITCENYVAVIVGSMPAFASFFKGKMPGASWLASINSLVLKSRASSRKLGLSHQSDTGIPSFGESMNPASHARDKGYLELLDTRHLGDEESRSVRTVIRGEGTATRTLDEGVVHKTIDVHQSIRQDPLAA